MTLHGSQFKKIFIYLIFIPRALEEPSVHTLFVTNCFRSSDFKAAFLLLAPSQKFKQQVFNRRGGHRTTEE